MHLLACLLYVLVEIQLVVGMVTIDPSQRHFCLNGRILSDNWIGVDCWLDIKGLFFNGWQG